MAAATRQRQLATLGRREGRGAQKTERTTKSLYRVPLACTRCSRCRLYLRRVPRFRGKCSLRQVSKAHPGGATRRRAAPAAGLGPCARLWSHMRGRAICGLGYTIGWAGARAQAPAGQTPAHTRARVAFLARVRTGFSLFRASLTLYSHCTHTVTGPDERRGAFPVRTLCMPGESLIHSEHNHTCAADLLLCPPAWLRERHSVPERAPYRPSVACP